MKYIKLFEEFRHNLYESLSGAREMYVNTSLISQEDFNKIKELDPSKNFKYVEKMIEFYLKEKPSLSELGEIFKNFDSLSKRNQIKNPDISRYKTFKELVDTTQMAKSTYSSKKDYKEKSSNAEVIYENDKLLVLNPKTHEAVCKYGANTKWCITEQNPRWYSSYRMEKATHYFILLKGESEENPYYKMAVSIYPKDRIECFDSLDNEITIEKVLEITGLSKDIFKFNPLPLTEDEEIFFDIREEIRENGIESNEELIKGLLKDLKDVNIKDVRAGYGLLVMFLRYNLFECAEMLIKMGVDVNQKTDKGIAPIQFAYSRLKDGERIVKLMKEMGAEEPDSLKDLEILTRIVREVEKKEGVDIELIKTLLDDMKNINIQEPRGEDTLLNLVLFAANFEVAKLILDKGIDITILNDIKLNPLMCASVNEGSIEIMDILINKGINVNDIDEEGDTALSRAASYGILENVQFLYSKGADINIKNKEDKSAILYALHSYNFNLIKFLLEKGAEQINDELNGEYILLEAIIENEIEVIQMLLNRPDLEINIQDSKGMGALHWAIDKNNTEILELLLNHPNIDTTIVNKENKTPWDIANPEIKQQFPQLNPNPQI